jgi:hypothetical protein
MDVADVFAEGVAIKIGPVRDHAVVMSCSGRIGSGGREGSGFRILAGVKQSSQIGVLGEDGIQPLGSFRRYIDDGLAGANELMNDQTLDIGERYGCG